MSLLLALLTGTGLPPAPVGVVGRVVVHGAGDDDENTIHVCPACGEAKTGGGFRWQRRGDQYRRVKTCAACEARQQAERDRARDGKPAPESDPDLRTCVHCGEAKPLTDYYHRWVNDRHVPLSICKPCHITAVNRSRAARAKR